MELTVADLNVIDAPSRARKGARDMRAVKERMMACSMPSFTWLSNANSVIIQINISYS